MRQAARRRAWRRVARVLHSAGLRAADHLAARRAVVAVGQRQRHRASRLAVGMDLVEPRDAITFPVPATPPLGAWTFAADTTVGFTSLGPVSPTAFSCSWLLNG